MNSLQIVQTAISLAGQQRTVGQAPTERDDALRQYWADSQCRLQRWHETIHQWDVEIRNAPDLAVIRGVGHLAVIEELIFADVLTTVFTGLLATNESTETDHNPIAHSVFEKARQARQRTIALLDCVIKRNSRLRKPEPAVLEVCRGRQRAELWTDILIGYLPANSELAGTLGFGANRMDQFRRNIDSLDQQGKLDAFTRKLSGDTEAYFQQYPPQTSGNEALNRRIFGSIQAALGRQLSGQPSLAGRGI